MLSISIPQFQNFIQHFYNFQKMEAKQQKEEICKQLAETALAKGCVIAWQPGSYQLVNFALKPFQTSINFYQNLNHLSYVWQILFWKASNDDNLLTQILQCGAQSDEWIQFLKKIYNKSKHNHRKDSLTFCRCDYILEGKQPKIIEYNLMTVGMSSFNKIITQSHKLVFSSQKDLYFQNDAMNYLVEGIKNHYSSRKLKGMFIFVISDRQFITIFQQKYLEERLRSLGIKCKRVQLKELLAYGRKDQKNDLSYKGELVSFAYYFTGFNLHHYDYIGTREEAVNAQLLLTTSNVTCIPTIQMIIINTKIGQAYLCKPEILRRYLTQQQAQTLQKTFVQNYALSDLDDNQYEKIISRVGVDSSEWFLKPNMEGGGNNTYGTQILKTLSELIKEDRGKYSLMKRVTNNPIYENYMILKNMKPHKINCTYEIGRYGLLSIINRNLVQNIAGGYSIRTKQKDKYCSQISSGTDGYTTWKMSQDSEL